MWFTKSLSRQKNCSGEHFQLTPGNRTVDLNSMSTTETQKKARWCWRKDLAAFRGLTDRERTGFLLVLEWFENFRLRHELPAGREAARSFWRDEVLGKGRQRETWQLEQWEDAIKWYLGWLNACAEEGSDHRSLPERVRAAVYSAGSRRGLALETKKCYRIWAARYARFAGDEREVMREETATRFLTSVVEDEDCAYSTQKQALNALAFFFKHVLGREDPVFNVKLKKTGARVPVVLSQGETQRLFEALESPDSSMAPSETAAEKSEASPTDAPKAKKHNARYGLVARLQYGAGLRLSEVVRLRVKDVDLPRQAAIGGSREWHPATPSPPRKGLQRSDQAGGTCGKDREASDEPCTAALVCNAPARSRNGSSHDPGSARTRGHHNDRDLPARRDGGERTRGGESAGLGGGLERILRCREKIVGSWFLVDLWQVALEDAGNCL